MSVPTADHAVGFSITADAPRPAAHHRRSRGGPLACPQLRWRPHEGDRGLYVSPDGYTREAPSQADRANVAATLVDLERLADS